MGIGVVKQLTHHPSVPCLAMTCMVLGIVDSIRNMKRYDFYSLSSGAVKLPMRVEGGRSAGFDTVFEVEKYCGKIRSKAFSHQGCLV